MTGTGSAWDLTYLLALFVTALFSLSILLNWLGHFYAEAVYSELVKRHGWNEMVWPEDVSYEAFWDLPAWLHWLPRGTHLFLTGVTVVAPPIAVLLWIAVFVHGLFV